MTPISSESTNYITRSEYETRHAELRTELIRLSTEHDTHFKWVVDENMKMRNDIQAKFDILTGKVDAAGASLWKIMAIAILNFMMGGGLIALLNYLHFPR